MLREHQVEGPALAVCALSTLETDTFQPTDQRPDPSQQRNQKHDVFPVDVIHPLSSRSVVPTTRLVSGRPEHRGQLRPGPGRKVLASLLNLT